MTIKEELIKYSNDCLNDVIPSGQKHKWACLRFLNDIKNSELNILSTPFEYYWNEEEANKIVKWFGYLKHSKGVLAGQFITLNTWQKFCLCQIYGWENKETFLRRFTKSFIEVARKNAKSQMEAGVTLYEMSTRATKNKEIYECYCAGVKREQSEVIFNECKNMLKGSPLRGKFKITKNSIQHVKTTSSLKPLNKQDGKEGDGSNPALLVLDEYHQHKTTEFYDLGLGGNTKESLLMIITTAGVDLTYPCFTQEYTYCSKILDPNVDIDNEEYFIDICEIDEDDDIEDEESWKKANPIRMTYDAGIKKIRGEYKIAKEIPEKMIAFLTKCLNKWVQAKENGYMNMAKWKKCEVKEIPYDLRNRVVYVGFDMSAKIDLTSVAFIIPILSDELDSSGKKIVKYVCFSHSFIPNRTKLRERMAVDKVPYDSWERSGYLTITNTEIVDQQQVMDYVLETCKKNNWRIETLCFDPANASKMMIDLSNEGYVVEEVFQSHKSLNESTQGFREQIYCGNVIYTNNPLLNYAMSNAVIKTNNGLIKIDKDATTKRIDPVDALLCAFKLALYHEFIDITDTDEWLEKDEW
ncbi:terminase [Clostridium beijerinckii]|uniref:Terminase large subunit n=1 Tax=Clostridium beijerinckii TaxID=1520 RepID=A0AB74VHD7_CLOBE|nr:terminase TerL endonuclease subunit [Clostridium beijerinckii]NRZ25160.1 phage terminase large subunit-like protein [Clostridium beijerinckii]NYB99874.1 phage terminase large subunit-like protein [Clostridium beijerinckii]OOM26475.1 phage terminase [Clostridium beijerinckii]QUN35948.1 terminase large subunit [Clostridium beijerinckii]SQB13369.1 putative phage terminase large subunit [Clostridium beijerinckii]